MLHLTQKICVTNRDFKKGSLASIFNYCSIKATPSKTKILIRILSPLPTLSYTITKKPKKVFCGAKVIEAPKTHDCQCQ